MKRCPSCGASNAETAKWCSLCLQRFVETTAPQPMSQGLDSSQPGTVLDAQPVIRPEAPSASEVTAEARASGIAIPTPGHQSGFESTGEVTTKLGDPKESGSSGTQALSVPPVLDKSQWSAGTLPVRVQGSIQSLEFASGAGTPTPLARPSGLSGAVPSAMQHPAPLAGPERRVPAGAGFLAKIERDPLGRLVQRCSLCDTANPIEANLCSVCGTDFLAGLRPAEKTKEISPANAMIWGLIPGGGFLALGKKARFFGHAALVTWLLLLMVVLMVLSPGGLLFFKVAFALMGAAVWAGSALDARRSASGEGESFLTGKRPLLIFAASLALLFVIGFVVTWKALQNAPGPAGGGEIYELPSTPG